MGSVMRVCFDQRGAKLFLLDVPPATANRPLTTMRGFLKVSVLPK